MSNPDNFDSIKETLGEIVSFPRMPRTERRPFDGGGNPPHDGGMEARVAVLEEIAKSTKEALVGIRSEMAEMRKEMRDGFKEAYAEFRWLLGLLIGLAAFTVAGFTRLLGVLAHGFHWL